MDMPIYIFYHMYCVNDCFNRFKRTYDKINDSNLLNKIDKLFVILVGPEKEVIFNKIYNFNKVSIILIENTSDEVDTLNLIWEKSKKENFYCLHLHSKGVTHINSQSSCIECIESWIAYLEHFCIYRHESCIDKLKEGNTCGVELRSNPFIHYCGNFWWAKSDYIKNMTSPKEYLSIQIEKNFGDSVNLPENLDNVKKSKKWFTEFWINHDKNNIPITLNQSFLDFSFYNFKFPEYFYKTNSTFWSEKTLDVPSAWRGLENYIPTIITNFNLKNNLMLEFGVDYGYSTQIFSKIFKKVIGVDTFQGDICIGHSQGDDFYYNTKQQFKDSNVELYRLNYQNFIKNNDDRYDLIHIDIVHTYPETYECAEWSLKHSDVVLLHDTCSFPEIHKVCRDLSLKYKWGFINIEEHSGLGILYKQY